ncbi:MAG TPA: crosslink repair DNA glycosylase YcaQ family protein, partial [Chthoniobacter sp.]|nr:crosslink repair DNA glycosylase YcaQ family protein [Chthoniobacter sp.]
ASLAELARRYFTSHGPVTLQDFIAWSALTTTDARHAIHLTDSQLVEEKAGGKTYWLSSETSPAPRKSSTAYLLPGFDEFLLGYRDRSPSLDLRHAGKVYPSANGMFISTVVIDGQVLGTWKRTAKAKSVHIALAPFTKFSVAARGAIQAAAQRYGRFLGSDITIAP